MKPLLVMLGPTASGKTNLSAQICYRMGAELVSVDSRQVYRGMDIGTGKDLHEFSIAGTRIPYHMIDICNAGDQYNINSYQKDFAEVHRKIAERDSVPVLCGGSGFYIYALLKGHALAQIPVDDKLRKSLELLEKEELWERFDHTVSAYNKLADTSTRKRLIRAIEISEYLILNPDESEKLFSKNSGYQAVIYGLSPPVEVRRQRISDRLKQRLKNGLIEEVESLLKTGLTAEQLIYYGLEYKYVTLYLRGAMTYAEMSQRLETEIHRFAKRQMTFFRKMEKDGLSIKWLDGELTVYQQADYVIGDYSQYLSC